MAVFSPASRRPSPRWPTVGLTAVVIGLMIRHLQLFMSISSYRDREMLPLGEELTKMTVDDGLPIDFTSQKEPNHSIQEAVLRDTSSIGACFDKGPLLKVLYEANVLSLEDPSPAQHDDHDQQEHPKNHTNQTTSRLVWCTKLPSWTEVSQLYGEQPVVVGLETCRRYQRLLSSSPPAQIRIAGLFNTGTNALANLLYWNLPQSRPPNLTHHHYNGSSSSLNFDPPSKALIDEYYSVPWGKHVTLRPRRKNWFRRTHDGESWPEVHILPIVLVRDPYRWMASMCKSSYLAEWNRSPHHCPNLVRADADFRRRPRFRQKATMTRQSGVAVRVEFPRQPWERYASLADMWSEWLWAYYQAPFPRLMIRLEDVLFHGERLVEYIAQCVGWTPPGPHHIPFLAASKTHGTPADWITAVSNYGRATGRKSRMLPADLQYAEMALNDHLMQVFGYSYIPPPG